MKARVVLLVVSMAAMLWLAVRRADADTFTHKASGNVLKGRLLGRASKSGKVLLLVKTKDAKLRQLPEAEWSVQKENGGQPGPRSRSAPEPSRRPEYTWPPVSYKGKARDAAWLQRQYERFRSKLAIVHGYPVDLGRDLSVKAYAMPPNVGVRMTGSVLQVLEQGQVLLRVDCLENVIHIKGISTGAVVDGQYVAVDCACIGTFRYASVLGAVKTVLSCVACPRRTTPITRDEFVTILRSGLELTVWKKRKATVRYSGKRYVIGSRVERIPVR